MSKLNDRWMLQDFLELKMKEEGREVLEDWYYRDGKYDFDRLDLKSEWRSFQDGKKGHSMENISYLFDVVPASTNINLGVQLFEVSQRTLGTRKDEISVLFLDPGYNDTLVLTATRPILGGEIPGRDIEITYSVDAWPEIVKLLADNVRDVKKVLEQRQRDLEEQAKSRFNRWVMKNIG